MSHLKVIDLSHFDDIISHEFKLIPSVVKSKPGFSVETDVIMHMGN
jgi:hypothetical protein